MSMFQNRVFAIACTHVALILSANAVAEPCQLTQTIWGNYRVEQPCELTISQFARPRLVDDLVFWMPDLIPVDTEVDVFGTDLSFEVKTLNDQTKDSGDFEITVEYWVYPPGGLSGPAVDQGQVKMRVASLAPGVDRRDGIGWNYVPGLAWGQLVRVIATVDSKGFATGGEVRELFESNNQLEQTCELVDSGEEPASSFPACG